VKAFIAAAACALLFVYAPGAHAAAAMKAFTFPSSWASESKDSLNCAGLHCA